MHFSNKLLLFYFARGRTLAHFNKRRASLLFKNPHQREKEEEEDEDKDGDEGVLTSSFPMKLSKLKIYRCFALSIWQ